MADNLQVSDPGTGPQPNNPLSRKLNKVLETRLDNDKVGACSAKIWWKKLLSFMGNQGANLGDFRMSCGSALVAVHCTCGSALSMWVGGAVYEEHVVNCCCCCCY